MAWINVDKKEREIYLTDFFPLVDMSRLSPNYLSTMVSPFLEMIKNQDIKLFAFERYAKALEIYNRGREEMKNKVEQMKTKVDELTKVITDKQSQIDSLKSELAQVKGVVTQHKAEYADRGLNTIRIYRDNNGPKIDFGGLAAFWNFNTDGNMGICNATTCRQLFEFLNQKPNRSEFQPIYRSVHPKSSDHLVSRDPNEGPRAGYIAEHSLGMVLP